tara:strand:- start:6427 stop:6957 length:531 start_codon:yes stop_codon:yes gene_type:complete
MTEEKTKLNEQDLVKTVRSTIKVSSCLNDIDNLHDDKKYFKYQFRTSANRWSRFVETHTSTLMKSFTEENGDALIDVYTAFDKSCSQFKFKTEARASLIQLYCKLKSSIWDIENMEKDGEEMYNQILAHNTKVLVNQIERQYPEIKNAKDLNGVSVTEIIDFLNGLGNDLMYKKEK